LQIIDKRKKFDHHLTVNGKSEKSVSTHARSDNRRMCTAYNNLLSNDAVRQFDGAKSSRSADVIE